MIDRRTFIGTAVMAATGAWHRPTHLFAQAARFDLIIKGGRVVDPSLHLDGIRDIAISGGRIAAVDTSIAGQAADTIDARSTIRAEVGAGSGRE